MHRLVVVVGIVVHSGGGGGVGFVGSVGALPAHAVPPPVMICWHVHCAGQSAAVAHVVCFGWQCEIPDGAHVGGGTSPVPDGTGVGSGRVPEEPAVPLLLPLLPSAGTGVPTPVPPLPLQIWSSTQVKPSPQSRSTEHGRMYFGTHWCCCVEVQPPGTGAGGGGQTASDGHAGAGSAVLVHTVSVYE
jgi:hypothetical protein